MQNRFFKNNKGDIFDLSPLDIKNGREKGLTKLTDKEVDEFLNPPITEEQRANAINSKARTIIYSKYPLDKQSSAQLGIYGDEYIATMKLFIKQVIDISNKAIDDKIPEDEIDWAGLDK